MRKVFKVGDKVRYLRHDYFGDSSYFRIGDIYTVVVCGYGTVRVKGKSIFLNNSQIEIVRLYNAINILLYPEYIEKDGYLVPK